MYLILTKSKKSENIGTRNFTKEFTHEKSNQRLGTRLRN